MTYRFLVKIDAYQVWGYSRENHRIYISITARILTIVTYKFFSLFLEQKSYIELGIEHNFISYITFKNKNI